MNWVQLSLSLSMRITRTHLFKVYLLLGYPFSPQTQPRFHKEKTISKPNEAARHRVLEAASRARQHTHAVAHRASSTAVRQSYTGAAREGSERPSGRRAALALPAMRKLALLAALWMRGARVFVRQSSETPGALELGMRRRHVARGRLAR